MILHSLILVESFPLQIRAFFFKTEKYNILARRAFQAQSQLPTITDLLKIQLNIKKPFT